MDKKKTNKIPLGLKINNPGNIRFSSTNSWLGECGVEKGFVKFSNFKYGIRALVKILFTYKKHLRANFNISNIIKRYAPLSDNNDTDTYITFVSNHCNMAPRSYYDISDLDNLYRLVCAICKMETGFDVNYKVFLDSVAL